MSRAAHRPVPAGSALLVLGVLATLATLAGAAPAAARVDAEARLAPRVVRLGDTVRFEIEVVGEGLSQPRLHPRFQLQNLEIVGGPEQFHGLQLGTGGVGWRFSWTWLLRPRTAGTAGVTSIQVLAGDQVLELPSRRIQVRPGRSGGPADSEGTGEPPEVLLRTAVDPPRPFVGQRTVYTVYLYSRVNVRTIEAADMPSFTGCWARDVDLPPDAGDTVDVQGTLYRRKPIYRRELYPLRAGSLDLGVIRARFLIDRIVRNRLFFGPVRTGTVLTEESNRIVLPVRPLPEPDPDVAARFHGAVGTLDVSAHLDRREVAVGHGTTLTVAVSGPGHLEALRPPAIDPPDGIDLIGPEAAAPVTAAADGSGTARRSWSYVLVPRRTGSWNLPPVEMAYFDPSAGRYRLASSPLPELVAHPPAQRTADTAAGGLHSIRSAALPGPSASRLPRLLPWAFGIPWLLALALLVVRETGPGRVLARLRWPLGAGGERLRILDRLRDDLQRATAEDRSRRAANGLERAWRSFLVEVFALPETVPVSGWTRALADRGVPEPTCRRLVALLEDLHFLRYAPELSDAGSVAAELAARFEALAEELVEHSGGAA